MPTMCCMTTDPFTKPRVSAALNEAPPLDPFSPCATVTHRREVTWWIWLLCITVASVTDVLIFGNVPMRNWQHARCSAHVSILMTANMLSAREIAPPVSWRCRILTHALYTFSPARAANLHLTCRALIVSAVVAVIARWNVMILQGTKGHRRGSKSL